MKLLLFLTHLVLSDTFHHVLKSFYRSPTFIEASASASNSQFAGRPQHSYNFQDIISQCSKSGVYTAAVKDATHYLYDPNSMLTPSGLTSVIKIYGLSGNIDDAVQALSVARGRGLTINIKHINAVINACKKHKRYDEALSIYEKEVKEGSLRPDVATISSIISVLGSVKKWERALTLYDSVGYRERDQILFSSILSALDANSRANECVSILDSLSGSSSSIQRTVHMYTSTISALGKVCNGKQAWKIYQQALNDLGQTAKSDKVLTYLILKILDEAKMFEKAALVRQNSYHSSSSMSTNHRAPPASTRTSRDASIDRNRDRGRDRDDVFPSSSFSDLIREARRTGDFRAAVDAADIWLRDSRSVLSPGGVTSCISIYGLAKMPDKALAVLDLLQNKNLAPNVVQYNAIMSACVRGDKAGQALALFEKMRDNDSSSDSASSVALVRDEYSYGIVLSAMAHLGRWSDANELLNNLPGHLKKTTVMCNTVLGSLSAVGETDLLRTLFEAMRTQGPAPDKTTFYIVLSALEKIGSLEEAAKLRSEIGLRSVASVAVSSSSSSVHSNASPTAKLNRNITPDAAGPHWGIDGDELADGDDDRSSRRDDGEKEESGNKKLLTLSSDELEIFSNNFSPAGTLEQKLIAQGRGRRYHQSPYQYQYQGTDGEATPAAGIYGDNGGDDDSGAVKWEGGGAGVASLMKLLGISGKTTQVIELLRRVEEEDKKDLGGGDEAAASGECTIPTAVYNAAILACAKSDDWRRALEAYAAMTVEAADSLRNLKDAPLKVPRNRRTYEALLPAIQRAVAKGDEEALSFLSIVQERARFEGLA